MKTEILNYLEEVKIKIEKEEDEANDLFVMRFAELGVDFDFLIEDIEQEDELKDISELLFKHSSYLSGLVATLDQTYFTKFISDSIEKIDIFIDEIAEVS